jgi:hypothetical protein
MRVRVKVIYQGRPSSVFHGEADTKGLRDEDRGR